MHSGFPNWRLLPVLLAIFAGSPAVLAEVRASRPYQVDEGTLHLWHLDEAGPPFADAVEDGISLHGLLNGARAGEPSMKGLGNAVAFNASAGGTPGFSDLRGAILTAAPVTAAGPGDDLPAGFRYFGQDGAFTFEMVVKLDVLPQEVSSIALALLTMEGDDADRIFNFRIEKQGFLSFIPLPHGGAMG